MIRKSLHLIFVFSLVFIQVQAENLAYGYPNSSRTKQCVNTGWKFHLGNPEGAFYKKSFDDAKWETISVPHTLQPTSLTLDLCTDGKDQPSFQRNVGWYRKTIEVTNNANKKVFLEFEGAHQVTDLWVNGKHVGQFAVTGYSPFHFDITDFVEKGKGNQVTLLVDNRKDELIPPDPGPFDYVKFSGLYRDVYLVETDPVHITFNWESIRAGITITTPTVDPVNMNAVINVKAVVRNENKKSIICQVVNRIIDHKGIVVLKLKSEQEIKAENEFEFNQIGAIEDNLQLWDTENPYLYRVNTEVLVDGKSVDCLENKLGIRSFRLDNELGFMLNGKPIDLIGYNRHQHYAYIGDALPNSLHYKDMLQFKQLGFNVVRTAHYPQDNALFDACDELGILVYEEAPTWITISKDKRWFDNLEKAARIMVRNHRNHPSVVIWGAGINHRGYVPQIHLAIKQEDPVRLTASQSARWSGWQASGLTDIYANMLYGPFIWDRSETILAMEGHSGPKEVAINKRDPKRTGIISWTAHAYYTFHPTHAKYKSMTDRTRSGAMTIFRQPKKGILWYPSEMRGEPYLHIEEDWSSKIKELNLYSNADEVELFVNGKSFMKQKPLADSSYIGLDHPPYLFKISRFEAGELKAVGYKDGTEYISKIIRTPENAKALKIVLDTLGRKFDADGSDILVAYAQVVDGNGTLVRDSVGEVTFSISGPAKIYGDKAGINANPMFIETGEAPVLIQAGTTPGVIRLTAKSKGLKSVTVTFTSAAKENDMVLANAKPIYDFEKIRVDLGASDQLVQFGWNEWSGEDNYASETKLDILGGIKASIKANSENGVLRWLGEMNVIGKYGFAYGEGVLGIDKKGVCLEFANLPKGTYKLTSWHHAPNTNTDEMDTNVNKLKELKIPSLPYAKEIAILVNGKEVSKVSTTNGKEMQFATVATAETVFVSDGVNPVKIVFVDAKTNKGIWLNAFELTQWNIEL
ncbi:glycoside hydrolase family 2 protein [Labilibaculum antarcticum]|uniref:Glycoside hydrolase family 2 n=1 Tax=Labilibaculum antarcticum TaxID=1717717 RepID=A0A1Y1CKD3_9BACT|nr:glycoside hydrolase family 2 TIM barrel-domain containing protein [Labilibaculum antarcticum]BAX80750.1 glycoside hydrolase family 2 [Labilibaculum antarcticum]